MLAEFARVQRRPPGHTWSTSGLCLPTAETREPWRSPAGARMCNLLYEARAARALDTGVYGAASAGRTWRWIRGCGISPPPS